MGDHIDKFPGALVTITVLRDLIQTEIGGLGLTGKGGVVVEGENPVFGGILVTP